MLRFLTHKLKSHSLNEEPQLEKAQEDHDSGTESDDESGDTNGLPGNHNGMEHEDDHDDWSGTRRGILSGLHSIPRPRSASSGGRESDSSQFESVFIDSALPSDSDLTYDHHSSEEELEVINNCYGTLDEPGDGSLLGDDEVRGPGSENKRKWSQVASNRLSVESSSSSDEEVTGLLRPLSTPVEFCTSPPVDVHKPSRSQSPPPKLFFFSATGIENAGGRLNNSRPVAIHSGGVFRGLRRCDTNGGSHHHAHVSPVLANGLGTERSGAVSGDGPALGSDSAVGTGNGSGRASRTGRDSTSRKRHRHHNPRHIQRPWLDFEKMQQLKARSVTTWRSGGELSLYCS